MFANVDIVFPKQFRAVRGERGIVQQHVGHIAQDIQAKMQPADLVEDDHVEGRGGRAFFQVAPNMKAIMRLPAMQEIMDDTGISMEGKDDGRRRREYLCKVGIAHAMRMAVCRAEPHQIHDVDDAHFQIRRMLAQHPGGGDRFLRRDVTSTGQHDVRLRWLVAIHIPDTGTLGAVGPCLLHCQPLQLRLFIDDDQIEVVPAFETMVCNR